MDLDNSRLQAPYTNRQSGAHRADRLKSQPKFLTPKPLDSPASARYLRGGKKRQCHWTSQTSASAPAYLVHPETNQPQNFITQTEIKWTGNSNTRHKVWSHSKTSKQQITFHTQLSTKSKLSPFHLPRFTLKRVPVPFPGATGSSYDTNLSSPIPHWQLNDGLDNIIWAKKPKTTLLQWAQQNKYLS